LPYYSSLLANRSGREMDFGKVANPISQSVHDSISTVIKCVPGMHDNIFCFTWV
jgi:hypothetical protein